MAKEEKYLAYLSIGRWLKDIEEAERPLLEAVRLMPHRREGYAELAKVLNDPATKKMLSQRGTDPLTSTPDEFARFIRSEAERWGKVVRASGATAD